MGSILNVFHQFCFCPPKLCGGFHVPVPFFHREVGFHDDHILRPADSHCQTQKLGRFAIHAAEIPHPAQIARGETGQIGICVLQIFRRCDSGALFCSGADQLADLAVQFHLGQFRSYQTIQGGEQLAVVDRLSDIHGFSFPAWL